MNRVLDVVLFVAVLFSLYLSGLLWWRYPNVHFVTSLPQGTVTHHYPKHILGLAPTFVVRGKGTNISVAYGSGSTFSLYWPSLRSTLATVHGSMAPLSQTRLSSWLADQHWLYVAFHSRFNTRILLPKTYGLSTVVKHALGIYLLPKLHRLVVLGQHHLGYLTVFPHLPQGSYLHWYAGVQLGKHTPMYEPLHANLTQLQWLVANVSKTKLLSRFFLNENTVQSVQDQHLGTIYTNGTSGLRIYQGLLHYTAPAAAGQKPVTVYQAYALASLFLGRHFPHWQWWFLRDHALSNGYRFTFVPRYAGLPLLSRKFTTVVTVRLGGVTSAIVPLLRVKKLPHVVSLSTSQGNSALIYERMGYVLSPRWQANPSQGLGVQSWASVGGLLHGLG